MRFDSQAPSTPPASPEAMRRQRPESLIPPRNAPSAGAALVFAVAAGNAALSIEEPNARALTVLACAVVTWAIGYFTPPPRRKFRRGDP